MNTFDLVLGIGIGYVAIGCITFLLELFLDGNVFEIIVWDMRDYDKWISFCFLVLACIGAWPMIIGFELLNRRR